MAKKCAKGHFCITKSGVFITLSILLICAVVFIIYNDSASAKQHIYTIHSEKRRHSEQPPINVVVNTTGGDSRYTRAPQPLRDWRVRPELPPMGAIASVPFGIATKGLPEEYQSIGAITTESGEALPLYGRRTTMGGDRWNYYTRTDTYNPIPVPIKIGKRDCTEDVGCEEVSNGDNIALPIKGQTAKVHIYNMSGPRYYPGLI
jgi:hypothetical protein